MNVNFFPLFGQTKGRFSSRFHPLIISCDILLKPLNFPHNILNYYPVQSTYCSTVLDLISIIYFAYNIIFHCFVFLYDHIFIREPMCGSLLSFISCNSKNRATICHVDLITSPLLEHRCISNMDEQ